MVVAALSVVLTAVVWESLGNSTKLHAQRDRTQTDPSCFMDGFFSLSAQVGP